MRFFLLLLMSLFVQLCFAQTDLEISEENFLKEENFIQAEYGVEYGKLEEKYQSGLIDADSCNHAMQELLQKMYLKTVELALKYASTQSGLHSMYMVRAYISKDSLVKKLSILPDSLMNSRYAQYIRRYIDTEQLNVSDYYVPFVCHTADGESFYWNNLKGKHFLLIFDGLYCMGENGRIYLQELLDKTDRGKFEIVVYIKCENLQKLAEEQNKFPLFKLISDFQPEGNPMNIVYNCQATPTCFMVDERGVLQLCSLGIRFEQINEYLKRNECFKR